MDTAYLSVTELEEMLPDDVPCGGNGWPTPQPCPNNAAAVLRWEALCGCPQDASPRGFKCVTCYQVWMANFAAEFGSDPQLLCERGLHIGAPFSHFRFRPL